MRFAMAERQRGVVLLVSLIFLVLLTLLGVTAINNSSINLRIVGNMQLQQQAEAEARRGIEIAISSINAFTNKTATVTSLPTNVTVPNRSCLWGSTTGTNDDKEAYSMTWELAPETTIWEVQSTYNGNGTNTTIHQGVRIKMSAGNC